jgi:transposase InsO family protein
VRFVFIKGHTNEFPVEKMCKVLKVSTSGYYKWLNKTPSQRALRNEMVLNEIKLIYRASKCRYGSPRITKELNVQGIKVSKVLVAKLMKQESLKSITRKGYKATTDSAHNYPVVENVLNRAFSVKEKNMAWVSDITYIGTNQGWLYLTTVIDLFDRKVIGWALSSTMKANETVIPAFDMAICNRPIQLQQALIFHSDRGIQYACEEFTSHTAAHPSLIRSMSRKGNCWDNAVAESFFKTLKTELVYHHKFQTRQEAALSIFEYIETFYNTNRRHKKLNNLTINEYQKSITNNLKNAA